MKTFIVDILKRFTPWNKTVQVYSNDIDNAYPERMDRLINNSVTAKSAATIMKQYLIGLGFSTDQNNFLVNGEKKTKLIDFASDVADCLVRQRGVVIHVNINANYKMSDASIIPFDWARVGKKDSKDYNGKILICKNWASEKIDIEKDITKLDVFNLKKEVIDAQVKKAGGWTKYQGQCIYINLDPQYIYPLSTFHSVQNDCDSEAQAAVYKNELLRRGFFGHTLVVTRPLISEDIEEYIEVDGVRKRNPEYADRETEREEFQKAIKDTLGAKNAGGVLCLEMDFAGEKLEDAILIKQIESKIDDKLFDFTERSVRDNILVAANNLPVGLIRASEGVFGNSGESLKEMKRTYWENTSDERKQLENILNDLMKNFEGYGLGELKVASLLQNQTTPITPQGQ